MRFGGGRRSDDDSLPLLAVPASDASTSDVTLQLQRTEQLHHARRPGQPGLPRPATALPRTTAAAQSTVTSPTRLCATPEPHSSRRVSEPSSLSTPLPPPEPLPQQGTFLCFNVASDSVVYRVYRYDLAAAVPLLLTSGGCARFSAADRSSAGISSITHDRYDGSAPTAGLAAQGPQSSLQEVACGDSTTAVRHILAYLVKEGQAPSAVGHRFAHGGAVFDKSVRIDDFTTLFRLEQLGSLAPQQNPIAVSAIRVVTKLMPNAVQFATFDTVFHRVMPPAAAQYAVTSEWDKYALRKPGMHGLSFSYVAWEAARFLSADAGTFKLVACHLGTGDASVCAISGSRSIDTGGLLSSTSCTDLDPSFLLELLGRHSIKLADVAQALTLRSGLLGVSGVSGNILELLPMAAHDPRAALAVDMYVHRLRQQVGSALALLGGAGAIVFTHAVGVSSWQLRERVLHDFEWAGVLLNEEANHGASVQRTARVSAVGSRIEVLTMPSDEPFAVAMEGLALVRAQAAV